VATAAWVSPAAVLDVDLPTTSPSVIWNGLWPVLVGLVVVAAGRAGKRWLPSTFPSIPAGDAVIAFEVAARRLRAGWAAIVSPWAASTGRRGRHAQQLAYLSVLPGGGVDRFDRRITRWRSAGALFAVLAAALVTLLLTGT
jgi:hypothetical protein